jgi:hypothetical protein
VSQVEQALISGEIYRGDTSGYTPVGGEDIPV